MPKALRKIQKGLPAQGRDLARTNVGGDVGALGDGVPGAHRPAFVRGLVHLQPPAEPLHMRACIRQHLACCRNMHSFLRTSAVPQRACTDTGACSAHVLGHSLDMRWGMLQAGSVYNESNKCLQQCTAEGVKETRLLCERLGALLAVPAARPGATLEHHGLVVLQDHLIAARPCAAAPSAPLRSKPSCSAPYRTLAAQKPRIKPCMHITSAERLARMMQANMREERGGIGRALRAM